MVDSCHFIKPLYITSFITYLCCRLSTRSTLDHGSPYMEGKERKSSYHTREIYTKVIDKVLFNSSLQKTIIWTTSAFLILFQYGLKKPK